MKPPFYAFSAWRRVLLKTFVLFLCFDALFMVFQPFDALRSVTVYGHLVPYRERILYADPGNSINNQLVPLQTMLAAHEIAIPKGADEYRTIVLGSSGISGYGDADDQTITAYLNRLSSVVNNKQLRAYNLAYPYTYLFKDLVIANATLVYSPDLLVLFVSYDGMDDGPDGIHNIAAPIYFLQINRESVLSLAKKLQTTPNLVRRNVTGQQWWERSIIFERRSILDWVRFQLNFVQSVPPTNEIHLDKQLDSGSDEGSPSFLSLNANWTALENLHSLTDLPILVVDEPVYIEPRAAQQQDQNLNYLYSKAQYDDYRIRLQNVCVEKRLWCLDLWNLVPAKEYTDSVWHRTGAGNQMIAQAVLDEIKRHFAAEQSNSTGIEEF